MSGGLNGGGSSGQPKRGAFRSSSGVGDLYEQPQVVVVLPQSVLQRHGAAGQGHGSDLPVRHLPQQLPRVVPGAHRQRTAHQKAR